MAKVSLKTWTAAMGDLRRDGVFALADGLIKNQSREAKRHLERETPVQTGTARRSWELEFNGKRGRPVVLANRARKPGSDDGYAQFIFQRDVSPRPGGLEGGLRRVLTSNASRHLRDAERDVKREVRGV